MNPADRAHDSARVVDLDAYRRAKFDREAVGLTAPGPNHPAARAMKAKEEAAKDKEFGDKMDELTQDFDKK